jgi:ferredoxin
MAIKITDDCINCEACEPECPNNAIYAPEESWRFSDGTTMSDDSEKEAVSDEFFYIATDKCTECRGFNEEPACAAVCPVDCCVDDEDNVETEEELIAKKERLHA